MGKKKEMSNSIPLSNANFGWSLKPITVLMAIFGQEIVIVGNNKKSTENNRETNAFKANSNDWIDYTSKQYIF